ncbi:MAG: hypothetical protein F4X11_16860 [Acidobacteria bacterium]|nr:hypothetical protein [Acidobacteriota bacterium]
MKNLKNTLVVCGGTGAHVALALVRLHTLDHALGFFRQPHGKPLAFPTLYLVDQDSGDGATETTAWQLVRRFVAAHPSRHNWQGAIGSSDPPGTQDRHAVAGRQRPGVVQPAVRDPRATLR